MFATLVAGLLAALPAVPAVPAVAAVPQLAEPAPTDVTVSWESVDNGRILVTWQEPGALGNRIEFVQADGSPVSVFYRVAAGAPNRIVIDDISPFGKPLRFRVVTVDATEHPVSEPGLSAAFDTDPSPDPILTSFVPREDGTLLLRWRSGTARPDSTPNDPLDLPAEDPPTFVPFVSTSNFNDYQDLSAPTTATTYILHEEDPATVGVRTTSNGWGAGYASANVIGTRLTATVPTTATNGAQLRVTGKAFAVNRSCDRGPCRTFEIPEPSRAVQLQSRTGPTAAWQVVSSAKTTKDGDIRFTVVSPGTRQYRVVAPVVPLVDGIAKTYFATPPVTTVSRPPATNPGGTPGGDPGNGDPGNGGGAGGGPLPITGAPVITVVGSGALLLVAGMLLTWVGRRRRTTAS